MCVIVVKPKDSQLEDYIIRQCWSSNPDGGGLMWSKDGTLHVEKGFMNLYDFMEFWKSREWDGIPAVLHFRIATHGGVNKKNTHPFWVFPEKLAFVHNGIFNLDDPKNKVSDTQLFNQYYLKQLPHNFLNNFGITNFIEDFIDPGSKLVFLNREGDQYIFNEDAGEWHENGCWFSNTFWEYSFGFSHASRNSAATTHNWDKFKEDSKDAFPEIDEVDDMDPTPWSSYDGEGTSCDTPSEARYERWYCWRCQYDFSWQDAFEWKRFGMDVMPECPMCSESEQCFGIGDQGLWVGDDTYIPGVEDIAEEYEANDWEKK